MKRTTGWAKCPGTCGEWLQGAKNGVPFLIGCPVNRFVEAWAEIELPVKNKNIEWRLPEGKDKTRLALLKLAQSYALPPLQGTIEFSSQLPTGKGMASSTADMIAAMLAAAHSLQLTWQAEELARLALEVEPSDPVMFEGIVEFAHRDGSYMKPLGPVVPAQLLMMDWGGSVDTQSFNALQGLSAHYRKNEGMIRQALELFYNGMENEDLEKLARAGTMSASCNQEINPQPRFAEFLAWVKRNGGLGVITAHSGTISAGVFPADLSELRSSVVLEEARLSFQVEDAQWLETFGEGIQGGVEHARRQSVRGQGEIRESVVY
jgi:L-threonine kinase